MDSDTGNADKIELKNYSLPLISNINREADIIMNITDLSLKLAE